MRRRRPRVVWLPPTNAFSVGDGPSNWNTFKIDFDTSSPGTRTIAEVPIVIDAENDPLAATTSLSDVENSGYRLRRIVGKIFIFGDPDPNAQTVNWNTIGVTGGLIVRRTDPVTGTSVAATSTQSTELIDPAGSENAGDPWIWHRNWLIQNAGQPRSLDPLFEKDCNTTNFAHGPALGDGPHVDQKTARILSNEERLFLDMSTTILEQSAIGVGTGSLTVFYSFRILGSMRTSTGNRRNASR